MKTVASILNQMTNPKNIMQDLKDTLRELDPMYQEEENKFLKACSIIDQEMKAFGCSGVAEYIAAKDEELAMELIYIGWQGFQLNLEIFKNPINALLLNEDYEDLHLERRLGTLTSATQAREVQANIRLRFNELPEEQQNLMQTITAYYSYLQTYGYKLAHYFGFRLADVFLPYVIPGYMSDPVCTFQYANDLTRTFQMNVQQIG